MPSNYEDMLPAAVSSEVIASVSERESAVMRFATTVRMPNGATLVPLVSETPISGFVDPRYGGLKPQSDIDWEMASLVAEELATILAIPNAFIDDASFPVWPNVREEISASFAGTFDRAALYGTDAPSSFPTGGLIAAAETVSGPDALAALDAALGALESAGVQPDGILGGGALKAALRAAMVATDNPFEAAPSVVYGVPVVTSTAWDDSKGLALVGGWGRDVIVGIRQDARYETSADAVITDGAGKVLVNAFQQDSTILRAYWRVALTVTKPVGNDGDPVAPLVLATVDGESRAAPARRPASKAS